MSKTKKLEMVKTIVRTTWLTLVQMDDIKKAVCKNCPNSKDCNCKDKLVPDTLREINMPMGFGKVSCIPVDADTIGRFLSGLPKE